MKRLRVLLLLPLLLVLPVALVAACSSETTIVSPSSSSSSSSGGGGSSSSGGADPDGGASSSSSSSSSGGVTLTPGTTTQTIAAAGRDRSVIVVVPPAAAVQELPLVIALHGNGDTAQNFVATSGLDDLAASKGFVLAAPLGIEQTVTVGGQTVPDISWDAYRTVANGNIDLPLLDAIRAALEPATSRTVVFGYSQGGYLSFRYAMEKAADLACGAVLAAANPLGPQLVTGAARKIPIAMQIGTGDFAINQARATKMLLDANAFPLDYHEIAGAGHVPIPGDLTVPLDYCLAQ